MSNRTRTVWTAGIAVLSFAGLAALATPSAAAAQRGDTGQQPLISYNSTFVPAGSTARVQWVYSDTAGGKTIVVLQVRGLSPNREYGAHAHKFACGATDPLAAGGHFQYVPDPVQPSTNPAYANPANEIWLDFTTDAEGNGAAHSVVDWQFPNAAGNRAHSVIIHDHHTATGDGSAGTAGPRYGCLTVGF